MEPTSSAPCKKGRRIPAGRRGALSIGIRIKRSDDSRRRIRQNLAQDCRTRREKFFHAQHAYIKRVHYDKAIRRIYEATGINLDTASIAIRNAVWSMAVQHGHAVKIIEKARLAVHGDQVVADNHLSPYQTARASFGNAISYQRQLLIALYEARIDYVRKIGQPGLEKRFRSEESDAVAEFTKYGVESNPS